MTAPWIDQLENTNINPVNNEFYLLIDNALHFLLIDDSNHKLIIGNTVGPVTPIWTDQIEA